MWFDVEAVPLSFTERAPFRFENEAVIRASPERVFAIVATGERQIDWFKDFVDNRWTSPEPHGVGSTREVELKALTVKERFLAWEPGRRLSFHIYGITLPLVTAMVEDLRFEPAKDGATRLVWKAHYRPRLLVRAIHPVVRAVFGDMFRQTLKRLGAYAADHPG
jgi:hypothetical protein